MGELDEVVYVGRPAWIGGSNGRHRNRPSVLVEAVRLERDSFPKVNSEAACFACLPKAWPFSGQSIPLRRMRSGRWL